MHSASLKECLFLTSATSTGPYVPATPPPVKQCVSGWSKWINKNDPTTGTGDVEKMTKEELADFCPVGIISAIECKDSDTKDDWTSLSEATCSIEDGLECNNLPFDGIPPCRNYEIRYQCNCSGKKKF